MARAGAWGWRHAVFAPLLLAAGLAFAQNSGVEVKIGEAAARRFTGAEIAALPQTELVETRSVGAGAKTEQAEVRYRGVLLRDLLDAAGVQKLDRHALRHSGVAARATDSYAVLFSWGELYNGRAGDNVLVITSMNGKPLPPGEGPYALRSLSDTKPGPRHVKWLNRIDFFTVPK
nr:molybdopterin-dependent oxidoreductase [Massilia brevitalea]